jgi:hypothetical protein
VNARLWAVKPSTIAIPLVVSLVLGIGAVVLFPVVWFLLSYGCGADEERLSSTMASLSILDARPSGAEPQGEPDAECEDDDAVPYVEQVYRFSGTVDEVASFYRKAAMEDGWEPYQKGKGLEEALCFTKNMSGHEIELFMVFGSPGEDVEEYTVNLNSGGGGWLCSPVPGAHAKSRQTPFPLIR